MVSVLTGPLENTVVVVELALMTFSQEPLSPENEQCMLAVICKSETAITSLIFADPSTRVTEKKAISVTIADTRRDTVSLVTGRPPSKAATA